MNLLTLEHFSKSYSDRILFENTDFFLQEGEKVGIIGINGTGKSTLLKILSGEEETDEGRLVLANHVVLGCLPQHPQFDPEATIEECVPGVEAKTMLTKLGFSDFTQKTGELSGGQRKRLALVSVLQKPADILILDEPTNHLDNEMADWLEDYLKKWRGALIMVTHDRYFLDSVATRIVEIDKGKIYSYESNYSGYLQLKAEREEMALASERKRQSILRTELAWIQRGARARSTKQKARIERYEELKNRQAPVTDGKVEMSSASTRLGRTTLELSNICKGYGEIQLIDDFSYIFLKNDRVGFIGENGCGKTTLMKILTGQSEPDSGTVITGQTVKIGYYVQEIQDMDPRQRVIDYIRDVAEYVNTPDGQVSASAMLERFLFDSSAQYSLVGRLSGGEKRRLNLLRVLMSAPNILVLDEPTNDLDITTLTILEDYLDQFDGIVITVSHDRYFLDRTVKRIFAFEEGGKLRQYEGGYSDYALRKSVEAEISAEEKSKKGSVGNSHTVGKGAVAEKNSAAPGSLASYKNRVKKLKFTFQEQRDYETIEAKIAELEETIEQLEADVLKYASDFVKLNEVTQKKEETEKQLEEKMEYWMYLEDKSARIEAGEIVEE